MPAGRIRAHVAMTWAEDLLRDRKWDAHSKSLNLYGIAVLASVMGGGSPGDPPSPPED